MLMTLEKWTTVKRFHMQEKWGNPLMMDEEFIFLLDSFAIKVGHPIIIHCGYDTDGHSPQSYHYKGRAADLHINGVPLIQQYRMAKDFGFTGIGVYRHWRNPGLHLDNRTKPASWIRDKQGLYHPLPANFMDNYTTKD